MHARRRGIASSVRPFRTEAPEWSNTDAKEIEAKVVELRKTGMTCAQHHGAVDDGLGVEPGDHTGAGNHPTQGLGGAVGTSEGCL